MKVKLGSQVVDSITGFAGIAIARTEYLNGCIQICVKARVDKDGKPVDGVWIDEQQLASTKKRGSTGGPGVIPPERDCRKL